MITPYDYLRLGWSLFPCHSIVGGRCTCGVDCGKNAGKHPRTLHGVKDASRDPRVVQSWEQMYGVHNINWALACGAASGVVAIDVDPRHEGDKSLYEWQMQNGGLPHTLTSITGAGGFHLVFICPTDRQISNRQNVLPGLDVRADGGYIMLPPSRHASGNQYAWRDSQIPMAVMPEHLIQLVLSARASDVNLDLAQMQPIQEGARNETLFRKACSLRRALHDDRLAVEAAVRAYNMVLCLPPLPEYDVTKILNSAFQQDHEDPELPEWNPIMADTEQRSTTDDGNALRLIDYSGYDLRYTEGLGWWRWATFKWTHDGEAQYVQQCARVVHVRVREEARAMGDEYPDQRDQLLRWANSSEAAGRIGSMMKLATSDERVLRGVDEFDRDPFLLGCQNGVLDLQTGMLREHRRDDLITQCTNIEFDPDFRLEEWERFIFGSCDGDMEVVEYLQRAVGYTLTGSVVEEAFFLITGPPASGKSTFIEGVQSALGDYAGQIGTETILHSGQPGRRDIDLANAFGKRLVSTLEIGEGDRLAESIVKQLTGGDRITARLLYKNAFSYRPQFKLWIATNHAPNINDQATWRRVKRIPFPRHLKAAERDPRIKDLIRDPNMGGKAILAWAVKGCQQWLKMGLAEPQRVTLEVHEYHADQDRLADFIAEMLVTSQNNMVDIVDVYAAYTQWSASIGDRPIRRHTFTAQMKERGFQYMRSPDGRKLYLCHVGLKQAQSMPAMRGWA